MILTTSMIINKVRRNFKNCNNADDAEVKSVAHIFLHCQNCKALRKKDHLNKLVPDENILNHSETRLLKLFFFLTKVLTQMQIWKFNVYFEVFTKQCAVILFEFRWYMEHFWEERGPCPRIFSISPQRSIMRIYNQRCRRP